MRDLPHAHDGQSFVVDQNFEEEFEAKFGADTLLLLLTYLSQHPDEGDPIDQRIPQVRSIRWQVGARRTDVIFAIAGTDERLIVLFACVTPRRSGRLTVDWDALSKASVVAERLARTVSVIWKTVVGGS